MKKEKTKNAQFLKEMWKNPKGKAILKLGMWGIFFFAIALILTISNLNSQNQKKIVEEKKEPTFKEEFLSPETIWNYLEMTDYHYNYQITEKENKETTTYQGEVKENIESGYKESKIGIVKYKIQDGKNYQIVLGVEEEIENIFEVDDLKYTRLDLLKNLLDKQNESIEEKQENRIITYQNSLEEIKITTNYQKILAIDITNEQKTYHLTYDYDIDYLE